MGLSLEALLAFILASTLVEITPGPNMAYLAVLAASEGRQKAFAAVAGVALGLLIVGLAAAFGLAAVISTSPFLFQALRWGGIAFMLWLAWDAWREEKSEKNEFAASDAKYFRRGLIVNLLNPKAAVFYLVILPQFVDATQPVLMQTVVLSVVFVAVATTIHATIVTLSGFSHQMLGSRDKRRGIRRIMAVALALIAVWFYWSTRG